MAKISKRNASQLEEEMKGIAPSVICAVFKTSEIPQDSGTMTHNFYNSSPPLYNSTIPLLCKATMEKYRA